MPKSLPDYTVAAVGLGVMGAAPAYMPRRISFLQTEEATRCCAECENSFALDQGSVLQMVPGSAAGFTVFLCVRCLSPSQQAPANRTGQGRGTQ